MAVDMAAVAMLLLGFWLTQEGLKAEAAWAERTIARRPALPRKLLGSLLVGCGISLAAMEGLSGLPAVVLYGVVAGGLHLFAFGFDPMKDKGMDGVDTFQTDRVARALEKAEAYLSEIEGAAKRANDRGVTNRVNDFIATARTMFRTIEDDPRDLSAARKFLGIYLQAARDATVKFADIYVSNQDQTAKADYFALLDDLEASFEVKREKLLETDRNDLDIEIEVLRDRLKRDGLLVNEQGDGNL